MKFKSILIIILGLSLWQCQPKASIEAPQEEIKNSIGAKANQPAKQIVRDSVPRRNHMMSRSRPKAEINANFPFDIPLEDTKKNVIASNELLPNNGKPTLVMFWLTTCYPCRIEMKAIKDKYDGWQKEEDFNVVGISTDWDKNYDNFVKMVNENNWPWKSFRDVNREFRQILPGELNGLPQTFIFDKNGDIAYHSRKYQTGDEDKIFEKIKNLN